MSNSNTKRSTAYCLTNSNTNSKLSTVYCSLFTVHCSLKIKQNKKSRTDESMRLFQLWQIVLNRSQSVWYRSSWILISVEYTLRSKAGSIHSRSHHDLL